MAGQLSLTQKVKRFYFTSIFRQTRHIEMYFDDVNKYLHFLILREMLVFLHCGVATIMLIFSKIQGHSVAQLIMALRYKPEGRGFDSCCIIDINLPSLGSTQPITDMSTNVGAYG